MPEPGRDDETGEITFSVAPATSVGDRAVLLQVAIAVAVAVTILLILQGSRAKIETNSVVVAVLPVLFWLLFTGRITGFKAFGVEIQAAIDKASRQPVGPGDNLTKAGEIEFDATAVAQKRDTKFIQDYIEAKIPVLSFELGPRMFYAADAMKSYIDEMASKGSLRWIEFHDAKGVFQALIPVARLRAYAEAPGENLAGPGYWTVIDMIRQSNLAGLPGVITASMALKPEDSKATALARFSRTDADDLPVVSDGRLTGVLNRGKLNSQVLSTILNAAQKVP